MCGFRGMSSIINVIFLSITLTPTFIDPILVVTNLPLRFYQHISTFLRSQANSHRSSLIIFRLPRVRHSIAFHQDWHPDGGWDSHYDGYSESVCRRVGMNIRISRFPLRLSSNAHGRFRCGWYTDDPVN